VSLEHLADGRKRLTPPLSDDDVRDLQAGDVVLVKGTVIGARDAAHKRMAEMLDRGEPLPFDPRGALIYYVGPTPERPGNVIGAAGPTTGSRMDRYTTDLLEQGVKAMMGKGGRGPAIRGQLVEHTAVYEDLGPEAIREIDMDDFPAWVVNDCMGRDYYAEAMQRWRRNDLLTEDLRAPERDAATAEERGALGGGL
jgi:fumarate hydratase subunit beta